MKGFPWQRWLPPFAVYTALGVFTSTEILLLFSRSPGKTPPPLASLIATECVHWYIWAAFSLLIARLVRLFPFSKGRRVTSTVAHAVASCSLAALHLTLYILITRHIPGAWYVNPSQEGFVEAWKYFFAARVNTNVLTYFGIFAVIQAREFLRRILAQELTKSRLETQLANARLSALKMQLHPHFLFNTLNAISALVHQDTLAAERMLQLLSDLLRQALADAGTQEVPLRREVEFLETYLQIERVRFGDRLQIEVDVDPEALDALVPNLILQPLVENAIRHGIARVSGPGRVRIEATVRAPSLVMCVKDDGPGFAPSGTTREGVGLGTTRGRLRQLYGADQSIELDNVTGGGAQVTIRIPFRSAPQLRPELTSSPT